jgi:hypothetical protein
MITVSVVEHIEHAEFKHCGELGFVELPRVGEVIEMDPG